MDIIITKQMIDEALDFYNIRDDEYKKKCYECVDELEKNKQYLATVENYINSNLKDEYKHPNLNRTRGAMVRLTDGRLVFINKNFEHCRQVKSVFESVEI